MLLVTSGIGSVAIETKMKHTGCDPEGTLELLSRQSGRHRSNVYAQRHFAVPGPPHTLWGVRACARLRPKRNSRASIPR